MKQALVTGGAGLIGSHLVDQLRDAGVAVRVLDALVQPTHPGRPSWLRDDVEYVFGDVCDDATLVGALENVDVLFHLAAFGGFAPGIHEYVDVNVRAYCRILELVRERRLPLRRAVVASTQGVYGEGASRCVLHGVFQPLPRRTPDLDHGRWEVRCATCGEPGEPAPTAEEAAAPVTPYAISKRCLEDVALRIGEAYGVAATVLRFGLTYGSRQSSSNPYCGIVPLFSQRMLRGRSIVVYEDGLQTRDFVHVSDVARANHFVALRDDCIGGVYNVGSGSGTAVVEIVRMLGKLFEVDADVRFPGWYRTGEVRHLWPDPRRLNELGWRARMSLGEGLAEFADWFRERRLARDPFPEGLVAMQDAGIVRASQRAVGPFDGGGGRARSAEGRR